MDTDIQPALRVSQLDSSELDGEVFILLKNQLQNIFKYFKPRVFSTYTPEVSAALRGILCYYALKTNRATIGQQLLGLQYISEMGSCNATSSVLSQKQKILLTLSTVGGPWLEDRLDDLMYKTQHLQYSQQIWRLVQWLISGWKAAVLVNFLVFLTKGRYQFLTERLIGIRPIFPQPRGVRQVGFEMMDREILWHGFAEFLFFVLPLINFRKIRNLLIRQFVPNSASSERTMLRSPENYRECAACNEWPYNPHEIGCPHVFCYICLTGNLKADQSYSCPVCGHRVAQLSDGETSDIRPVTLINSF